jgi:hypothetical protein
VLRVLFLQVRQHQLDLFAAQESLRVTEEELSKALSVKEILEARIAGFANEMVDLRQAAGPTANLISRLKEDTRNAQLSERSVREELRAVKEGIKPKQKEPFMQINEIQSVSVQTIPDPRTFWANTDDDTQTEAAKMREAMEGYRERIQAREKDETVDLLTGDVALESVTISKLKAEIDTMEKKLHQVEQWTELEMAASLEDMAVPQCRQGSGAAGNDATETNPEAEIQLRRLATQNRKIVRNYQHVIDQYKKEHAKAQEFRNEVQRHGTGSGDAGLSAYFCSRALQLVREVCGLFEIKDGPFTASEASALLEQSKQAEMAKSSFEKILQALLSLLKNKWANIADVIVTLQQTRQEVKELATEQATINFSQLVGATRLAEMQKALSSALPPRKMPRTMQERYEEQRDRWEQRKVQIRQQRTACMTRCFDSVMKVVEVNDKLQLATLMSAASSSQHSVRAVVHSTLLDHHASIGSDQNFRALASPPPQRVVNTFVYTLPIPAVSQSAPDTFYRLHLNSAAAERLAGPQALSARGQTRSRDLDHEKRRNRAMTARDSNASTARYGGQGGIQLDRLEGSNSSGARRVGTLTARSSGWPGWAPASTGIEVPSTAAAARKSGKTFLWMGARNTSTGKDRATNLSGSVQDQDCNHDPAAIVGFSFSAGLGQSWRSLAGVQEQIARVPEKSEAKANCRRMRREDSKHSMHDNGARTASNGYGVHVVKLLPFLL